ncbi:hypothetical protein SPRG_08513 [Saprolegnia parasitica CBS 223.65]|uniref:HSF-type DNA-binding domain-containing protein n=1 Tax=Saprolegnia parasitica (strain CBS 223.65) TaxID=695850 RepID=A0A067CH78_SAPPC|nr:hypothetical protein SPRG_08513 [Saprolegnia parasitica CBS 223.65]KDO26152.1 hypothetical protein SPRG_08513 [Saprolegnia parasitica CBS 223.65]|eukprot:XP_012203146.1 hypothetical protein SPRG_08513 [Saprolegnia parasitica CBS 223.65]
MPADLHPAELSAFLMEGLLDYTSGFASDDSNEAEIFFEDFIKSDVASPAPSDDSSRAPEYLEHTTKYMEKLYTMLEQSPESIAAWTNNGTSFAIFDNAAFEKSIIPMYFKPIKFESFARQLNSYGFRKMKYFANNIVVYEFRHPHFVRGKSDQLLTIKRRRRVKKVETKLPAEPTTDAELRSTIRELSSFVQTLHSELLDTKALVRTLLDERNQMQQQAQRSNNSVFSL